jgi:hypothetical protein
LWHLPVRTQIRTAQPGSIRGTGSGVLAATHGLSSSPAAGLTCQCIFESKSWLEGIGCELIACFATEDCSRIHAGRCDEFLVRLLGLRLDADVLGVEALF